MKNKYEINGDTTTIFITRRNGEIYEFLIDTEDLDRLKEAGGSWCVDLPYGRTDRKPYALRNASKEGGGREFVKMHRFLTNAPKDKVVDHIDGNTLDNRKRNLRVTDLFQNAQNICGPSVNNKSGVLNVFYDPSSKLWIAAVMRHGKKMQAKRKKLEDAAKCAEEMRNGTWQPRKRGRNKCS